MANILRYIFGGKSEEPLSEDNFTVSVAESITAGALANTLCAEPGASTFFKGGVVAYSIASKKEILGVDIKYAEKNNFANPFTTSEMAKAAAKMFRSRIGIATTGYSLPMSRPENKERGECELDIKNPYAYICLYDSVKNYELIKKVEYTYYEDEPKNIQRATVQTRVALEANRMYNDYVLSLQKR